MPGPILVAGLELLPDPVRIGVFQLLVSASPEPSEAIQSGIETVAARFQLSEIRWLPEVKEEVRRRAKEIGDRLKLTVGQYSSTVDMKYPQHYRHKWVHFPENVASLVANRPEDLQPKYAEISITLTCNFGCHQCTSGTWKEQQRQTPRSSRFMDWDRITRTIDFCRGAGVEAILFAAGGEPTLSPHLLSALQYAKNAGLKVGLYSNGSFRYSRDQIASILRSTDLFRISLHAVTPKHHADYHNIKSSRMVERVLSNIRVCSEINQSIGTNFGTNNVVNERNRDGFYALTDFLFSVGSAHPGGMKFSQFCPEIKMRESDDWGSQENHRVEQFESEFYEDFEQAVETYTRPRLEAVGIKVLTKDWNAATYSRDYQRCLGTGWYLTEIGPSGDVYFCTQHSGNDDFRIGNIFEETFDEIWQGPKRQRLLKENRDFCRCPVTCKQDTLNSISDESIRFGENAGPSSREDLMMWIELIRERTSKNEFI